MRIQPNKRTGARTLGALVLALLVLFVFLQYSLWFGDRTMENWWTLRERNIEQAQENARLDEINEQLSREVRSLSKDNSMIEELAREELDMVRKDEVLFRFSQPQSQPPE